MNVANALEAEFSLAYAQRASANTVRLAGALTGLAPEEALDLERRCRCLSGCPEPAAANLGQNLQLAYVEASRNAAEAVRLLQLAEQSEWPVFWLAQMAHAHALAGRPDEAMRLFADFQQRAIEEGVGKGWWAHAYIAVGDYGRAPQQIESAVNARNRRSGRVDHARGETLRRSRARQAGVPGTAGRTVARRVVHSMTSACVGTWPQSGVLTTEREPGGKRAPPSLREVEGR